MIRTLPFAALPAFVIACGADDTPGVTTDTAEINDTSTVETRAETTPETTAETTTETTAETTPETIAETTAETTPETTAETTTETDTSSGQCTPVTLSGALVYYEDSSPDEGFVGFVLDVGDLGFGSALPDQLWVEFYETDDATIDDTGTFDLASAGANDNYATCAQCVSAYVDIDDASGEYGGDLFQASGTLVVSSATPPSGGTMSVTISNLELIAVTIDADTYESTPVSGACYRVNGPVTLATE